MRWTLALPTDQIDDGQNFTNGSSIGVMASALQGAGVSACHVTDHPFPPAQFVARGGHHALDPLIALSFAAAATTTLLLHTNVYIAAYRHPVLAAHGVASLDALSDGRVVLGVAAGYLQGEFAALDVAFDGRGALLEQAVVTMKRLWAGEATASGNVLQPLPRQRPHPPIWFGGNSPAAIRRVVRHGQGWAPFPASSALATAVGTTPMADVPALRRALGTLRQAAHDAGRTDPIEVCCTPFSHPHKRGRLEPERLLEEAAVLDELGVTWLSVRLGAPSLAGYLENVEQFGKEVVAA
jgi:probable F420-dependent oxidoreductase